MPFVDPADPQLYATSGRHELWSDSDAVSKASSPSVGNFVSVTGYAQADRVLRSPDLFRSGTGNSLLSLVRADPASGRMLVMTDTPRHGELRRELAGLFSPRGARRLEPIVRSVVGKVLNDALAARSVDWVSDVAARIPVAVTSEILGVPRALRGRLAELTERVFGADDAAAVGSEGADVVRARAHGALLAMYADLVHERRLRPRSDVTTLLATKCFGGRLLDDDEVVLNCHNILLGGNETARHAIAAGTLALIDHPSEWDRLTGGCPVDAAVEEILRWTSPGMHVARRAACSTGLDGVRVPNGGNVVVWLAAANRDPTVFARPHDLALDRAPRHLAFGSGPHHCLGAAVARLELRVFFEELAARVGRIERAGPETYLRSNFIAGLNTMPVDLHPA